LIPTSSRVLPENLPAVAIQAERKQLIGVRIHGSEEDPLSNDDRSAGPGTGKHRLPEHVRFLVEGLGKPFDRTGTVMLRTTPVHPILGWSL
jgi:hypothetical protein